MVINVDQSKSSILRKGEKLTKNLKILPSLHLLVLPSGQMQEQSFPFILFLSFSPLPSPFLREGGISWPTLLASQSWTAYDWISFFQWFV